MSVYSDPKWMLKQAEIELVAGHRLLSEVEFRLKQSPYANYFDSVKSSKEYARTFARKLIWC